MLTNAAPKAYRGMVVFQPYLLTKFQVFVISRTTAHSQILRACVTTNSSKKAKSGLFNLLCRAPRAIIIELFVSVDNILLP